MRWFCYRVISVFRGCQFWVWISRISRSHRNILHGPSYLDLHKFDDSLVANVTGVKINSLSEHLVYSLEFADYNLVAFSKNNYSCVVTPCLLQFFKEGSIMIIQNNLHTKISCCCLFKVGFVVMHCLLECKLSW